MTLEVKIKRLPGGEDLPLPTYHSKDAVGMDLHAAVKEETKVVPGVVTAIPCGIAIALPAGYEAQIRPRSGLALKHGITVLNSPGTIDCDYRGEVKVLLINLGLEPVEITSGDRIAQLVVAPVSRLRLIEVEDLPSTARGAGGFGSTGR